MLLVRKLVVALIVAICTVLAVFSWFLFSRELRQFDDDVRGDHTMIGATLAGSVAMVWRNRGPDRALALVHEADRLRKHIRLRWVWPDAAAGEPAPALGNSRILRRLLPGQVRHVSARARQGGDSLEPDPGADEWLFSYTGVETPSGRVGAIEVAESLARKRTNLRIGLLSVVLATAALIAVSGALMLVLGVWFVGRPMARLTEKARRVGAGDLSGPLDLKQNDEIGELAAEMNAMCERLSEAYSRVGAETEARIAALQQLRHAERLATLGKLSAGIAHELGTPLNIIAGRAKMIARGKAHEGQIKDYALIIAEQSDRMTRIIRQLLDYARAREPKKTRQDLARIVEQTVQLVGTLAEKQGVAVRLEPSARLSARLDTVQMQQALTNLLVNAIHASSAGTTVSVEVGRTRARPPAEHGGAEAEYAYVTVRDSGVGMEPEVLARAFEPFFTTKPIGEGTGLGLAVTHGIIQEHGGWIAASSKPGQGSAFTLHIALEEVPDAAQTQ